MSQEGYSIAGTASDCAHLGQLKCAQENETWASREGKAMRQERGSVQVELVCLLHKQKDVDLLFTDHKTLTVDNLQFDEMNNPSASFFSYSAV